MSIENGVYNKDETPTKGISETDNNKNEKEIIEKNNQSKEILGTPKMVINGEDKKQRKREETGKRIREINEELKKIYRNPNIYGEDTKSIEQKLLDEKGRLIKSLKENPEEKTKKPIQTSDQTTEKVVETESSNSKLMNYYIWNIIENHPGPDKKRTVFLGNIFGNVKLSPYSVQKGKNENKTTFPLFEIPGTSIMVTAKGFGREPARNLHISSIEEAKVIMGMCLWDSRWKLISENGKVYRPGISEERAEIYSKNPLIRQVEIPISMGDYHRLLIQFQAKALAGIRQKGGGKRVYYHVPHREYENYINILPLSVKWKEELKKQLSKFVTLIERAVVDKLGEVEFISPLDQNPNEVEEIRNILKIPLETASLIYPYYKHKANCIGVEDFVEFSLLSSTEQLARIKKNIPQTNICAIFGILGIPHPYTEISPKSEEDVQILRL